MSRSRAHAGVRPLALKPLALVAIGVVVTIAIVTGFQYRQNAIWLTEQWQARDSELARILESTIPPLLQQVSFSTLRQSLQHSLAGDPYRRVSVLTPDGIVVADSAPHEVGAAISPDVRTRWETVRKTGRTMTWIQEEGRASLRHTLMGLYVESGDASQLPFMVGGVLLRSDLTGLAAAKREALSYVLKINWLSTCIMLLLLWVGARSGLLRLRPALEPETPTDRAAKGATQGLPMAFGTTPEGDQAPSWVYLAAWNSLSAHTAVLGKDGTILAVNEAWTQYGRDHGNPLQFDTGVGANYLDVCRRATGPCAEEARRVLVGLQAVLDGSLKEFSHVYSCEHSDSRQRFLLNASPLPGPDGGAVVAHMDITASREDTPPTPVPYDHLFSTLPVGVIYLSPNLTVHQINQQAADLYHLPAAAAIGRRLIDLLPPDRWSRLRVALEQLLETGQAPEAVEDSIPSTHKAGSVRHVRSEFYPDRGEDSTVRGVYGVVLDITADKVRQQALEDRNRELDQMAIRDPLTGLYNRRFFDEALDQEWRRFQRTGEAFTVVIMDVDRFKDINDEYGHDAGDRALQQVAATLRQTLRESDTMARVGGDEFAALLPGTAGEHSEPVVEKLRQILRRLRVPGATGGTIQITLSLGAACLPGIPPVTSAAELLRVADKRMYEAKRHVSSRKSHTR